jgi:hypothetical protein
MENAGAALDGASSDGKVGVTVDTPFRNAFRYRDWVVEAFNQDMPYDLFVRVTCG